MVAWLSSARNAGERAMLNKFGGFLVLALFVIIVVVLCNSVGVAALRGLAYILGG